jgi:hypothetical protein
MPWKCPACREPIAHAPYEDHPRSEVVYRCHICRLELVFDSEASKLVVAPIEDDEKDRESR